MLRFHGDRKQVFECKIKIVGADAKDSTTRLVLQDGDTNRIYEGKVDVLGNCKIDIPALHGFENSKGKATLEVRVNDVIFEPYKNDYLIVERQVMVNEIKIVEKSTSPKAVKNVAKKQKLYNKEISMTDKEMINELLSKFNKLSKEHKRTLRDYVEINYEPSKKVRSWAEKKFDNLDSIQAKMVMFEVEKIIQ
jgi:hypothetical protein